MPGISYREGCFRLSIGALTLFCFHLPYFALASLLTTFNGLIGYVSLGVMWLCWFASGLASSVVIKYIGIRLTAILSCSFSVLFPLGNFYPSYPTLVIGSAFLGLGGGPIWTVILYYVNEAAELTSCYLQKDAKALISLFHGIVYMSYFTSALLGSLISSAFLLPSQLLATNTTGFNETGLCAVESDFIQTPAWSRYGLLVVSLAFSILAVIISILIRGTIPTCCHQQGFYDTSDESKPQNYKMILFKRLLEITLSPQYLLVFPISFLPGVNQGFFFGAFAQVYTYHMIKFQVSYGMKGQRVLKGVLID